MTKPKSTKIRVIVFNVGSGDQILLSFPNGKYGLIDCHFQNNLGQAESPAITYLINKSKDENVSLVFLQISHPDFDHVKGFTKMWKRLEQYNLLPKRLWLFEGNTLLEIENIYQRKIKELLKSDKLDADKASANRASMLKREWNEIAELESRPPEGLEVRNVRDLKSLTVDIELLDVHVLSPLDKHVRRFYRDIIEDQIIKLLNIDEKINLDKNLISGALLLTYGDAKILMGADVTEEMWLDCQNRYQIDRVNDENFPDFTSHFIKGSHHGSRHSSSIEIWENLIKDVPVEKHRHIAFSAGKKYKHPHKDTLLHIDEVNSNRKFEIFYTATNMCMGSIEDCPYCIFSRYSPSTILEDVTNLLEDPEAEPKDDKDKTYSERGQADQNSGIVITRQEEMNDESRLAALVYDIDTQTTEISLSLWTVKAPNPYEKECIFPSSPYYYNR